MTCLWGFYILPQARFVFLTDKERGGASAPLLRREKNEREEHSMKISRRIASLSLALALAVGLAVPAMAAENVTGSVPADSVDTGYTGNFNYTISNVVSQETRSVKLGQYEQEVTVYTIPDSGATFTMSVDADGLPRYKEFPMAVMVYELQADGSYRFKFRHDVMRLNEENEFKASEMDEKSSGWYGSNNVAPGYLLCLSYSTDTSYQTLVFYQFESEAATTGAAVPPQQVTGFPAPAGGETVTFGTYTLSNVTGVHVLECEDPGMMMKWREYQIVCPEYAALTGPEKAAVENSETGEIYTEFSDSTPTVQLVKGYYGPFQLDGYNGDLTLFGETVTAGTYDFIDISIAAGMPAQEKFASAPDKMNGGNTGTQPVAPSSPEQTTQPAPAENTYETAATENGMTYTVKKYDTMGQIALNFYGSYGYHNALYKANAAAFKSTGGALKPGMTLILPDTLGSAARLSAPAAAEGETLYTVKAGDTLGTIAKTYYGDVMKYQDIFERNSDRLKNANTIYEGQVIILPAK